RQRRYFLESSGVVLLLISALGRVEIRPGGKTYAKQQGKSVKRQALQPRRHLHFSLVSTTALSGSHSSNCAGSFLFIEVRPQACVGLKPDLRVVIMGVVS